ncbi:hypothetical protein NW768_001691 [Fusarium equiseti]|uniref:Uncharacterized protein n=1 Tax=Fusarium equiseti TaxID=61235 RepID=A0ABQ8RR76_FUSEQ|nr:hypothetical protein NW768_001691 [Fusarium equiseti]
MPRGPYDTTGVVKPNAPKPPKGKKCPQLGHPGKNPVVVEALSRSLPAARERIRSITLLAGSGFAAYSQAIERDVAKE